MRLNAVFTCALATYIGSHAAFAEEQIVLSGGEEAAVAPLNVAIIGAGAGGSSAAYHLAKFSASSGLPVNITVFERNNYIGGRSTAVYAYDDPAQPVELGASIFVQVNQILVDAVRTFNLSTSGMIAGTEAIPGAALGVWDGESFVVTQNSDSLTWWDTAKFLWKYGLAPIRTMRLMKSTVGSFLKMYEEPQFPFASLSEVVLDLELTGATAATGEQYLAENGITGAFGHDVVQASTRVNYAQNLKYINGLLSMVCMATDGAMAVKGGNWQIFESMVSAANATVHLETQVDAVKKQEGGSYVLSHVPAADVESAETQTQAFDSVILAAPYQFSNISLPADFKRVPDEIPYVTLHVTLLTSPHLLSPAFFDLAPGDPAPKVILTTLPAAEQPLDGAAGVGTPGFFSISLLRPLTNPTTGAREYLYKIFSPSPPNSTFLTHLLGLKQPHEHTSGSISEKDISWIYRKVWHSYPYEIPRVTFEEVELEDGVWYTGGMDGFISTMETNALMGMNVARLVVERWKDRLSAVEAPSLLPGQDGV